MRCDESHVAPCTMMTPDLRCLNDRRYPFIDPAVPKLSMGRRGWEEGVATCPILYERALYSPVQKNQRLRHAYFVGLVVVDDFLAVNVPFDQCCLPSVLMPTLRTTFHIYLVCFLVCLSAVSYTHLTLPTIYSV